MMQRYRIVWSRLKVFRSKLGRWVKYSDAHALEVQNEELRSLLQAIFTNRYLCFIPETEPAPKELIHWTRRAEKALAQTEGGK